MSLLDEINKSKKIKLILSKHEEGAGFMASGYTKSTGVASAKLILFLQNNQNI